jgi:hypothetical protein
MKYFLLSLLFASVIVVAGIYIFQPRQYVVSGSFRHTAPASSSVQIPDMPEAPPPPKDSGIPSSSARGALLSNSSSTFASRLPNPPVVVRGLYVTRYVAGISSWIDRIVATARAKNLNAVVIDVKDYSGYVAYRTEVPDVIASGAESDIQVKDIGALLKKFHDNGIYTIARITVFQDPVLAKAHPEWALGNYKTGKPWTDKNGLRWMDPAGVGTWKYVAEIGHDALKRGFDEINFDYVRFPSDGDLELATYPFWNASTTPRHVVLRNFFKFLRDDFPSDKISVDIFGLTTVNFDDMGIGQVITDAYQYFDYVSPMVYPSHFGQGFIGYKNPAAHPYEVISYALEKGLARLTVKGENDRNASSSGSLSSSTASSTAPYSSTLPTYLAKLRPWLQEFDLGAVYTNDMIHAQIKATDDVLNTKNASSSYSPSAVEGQFYAGWLLWDPSNKYSRL